MLQLPAVLLYTQAAMLDLFFVCFLKIKPCSISNVGSKSSLLPSLETRVVLYSSSTCHPESLIIRAWKRSDKERCTFTGRARWPRPLVARGQWNSMKRNWGPGNIAPAAAERTVAKFSSVGNQVPRTAEPERHGHVAAVARIQCARGSQGPGLLFPTRSTPPPLGLGSAHTMLAAH